MAAFLGGGGAERRKRAIAKEIDTTDRLNTSALRKRNTRTAADGGDQYIYSEVLPLS